jgi:hypothetical protein
MALLLPEGNGDLIKNNSSLTQWIIWVAGNPGLNPGPGENFSLQLLIYDLLDGYSKS